MVYGRAIGLDVTIIWLAEILNLNNRLERYFLFVYLFPAYRSADDFFFKIDTQIVDCVYFKIYFS